MPFSLEMTDTGSFSSIGDFSSASRSYMAGVNRLFCIALCVISASGITLGVFRLNRKYGPHGLMKLAAAGYRPYYIINRKRITSLFKRRKYAKHTQSVHPGK